MNYIIHLLLKNLKLLRNIIFIDMVNDLFGVEQYLRNQDLKFLRVLLEAGDRDYSSKLFFVHD